MIEFILEPVLNAESPIVWRDAGKMTSEREEQLPKAWALIFESVVDSYIELRL